jgi:hypothetical protein
MSRAQRKPNGNGLRVLGTHGIPNSAAISAAHGVPLIGDHHDAQSAVARGSHLARVTLAQREVAISHERVVEIDVTSVKPLGVSNSMSIAPRLGA